MGMQSVAPIFKVRGEPEVKPQEQVQAWPKFQQVRARQWLLLHKDLVSCMHSSCKSS